MSKRQSASPDLKFAREVIASEVKALTGLLEHVGDSFQKAVDILFECSGRVIVTGIGKAGIIGQKISGTLASNRRNSGVPSK